MLKYSIKGGVYFEKNISLLGDSVDALDRRGSSVRCDLKGKCESAFCGFAECFDSCILYPDEKTINRKKVIDERKKE